jgi:hypothetical protein
MSLTSYVATVVNASLAIVLVRPGRNEHPSRDLEQLDEPLAGRVHVEFESISKEAPHRSGGSTRR